MEVEGMSMKRFYRRMEFRQPIFGFTLIEILVVVAIIAVLVAILLPGLKKARERAYSVKCMAMLKQDGIAMLMYAQDNNEVFCRYGETPEEYSRGIWYRWYYFMYWGRYLPELGGPYINCPAGVAQGDFGRYAMTMDTSHMRVSKIPSPDKGALLCDGVSHEAFVYVWSPFASRIYGSDRHRGGIHIAYCDGGVGWREGCMPTRDPGVNPWTLVAPNESLAVWVWYQLTPWTGF